MLLPSDKEEACEELWITGFACFEQMIRKILQLIRDLWMAFVDVAFS